MIEQLTDEEAHELANRLAYPVALLDSRTVYEAVMKFERDRRGLRPSKLSVQLLSEVLHDMAERVESGDSWEGCIEYLLPDWSDGGTRTAHDPPGDYDPDVREVRASFRIGNRDGQGGVRLIGEVADYGRTTEEAGG